MIGIEKIVDGNKIAVLGGINMEFKKGNIIKVHTKRGDIDGCIVINHEDNWVNFVRPNEYDYKYSSIREDYCEYISEGSVDLLDEWYENQKKYLQEIEDAKTPEQKFKESLIDMKQWKEVDKKSYEEWIQNYENTYHIKLAPHSIYFCAPPMHGKYDYSLNTVDKDGTVCKVAYMSEGGWYGDPNPNRYYVLGNIEEVLSFVKDYKK